MALTARISRILTQDTRQAIGLINHLCTSIKKPHPTFGVRNMAGVPQQYTSQEEVEVQKWEAVAAKLKQTPDDAEELANLNKHLSTRTTILGVKPSRVDVQIAESLAETFKKMSVDQAQETHPHVWRHQSFVQARGDLFSNLGNSNPVSRGELALQTPENTPKAGSTGQPKADQLGGVSAVGGAPEGKKPKAKKAKAPAPAPAPEAAPGPHLIDLRVGHILKAIKHPSADSLYVSTVAMGDAPGTPDTAEVDGQVTRTVCSGLNGLVPLEEMQGRRVVCVCNLKPVTMRGVKSCAMLLAASPRPKEGGEDDHKGPVELVDPPQDAKAGERVYFEGFEGDPAPVLNPKKKIWEKYQPGFTTTDGLEVAFSPKGIDGLEEKSEGKLKTTSGGTCTVKTLKNATVR